MQTLKATFKKNKFTHALSLEPKWNDLSPEDREEWDTLAPKILTPALRQFDEVIVEITPDVACSVCKSPYTTLVTVSGGNRSRLLPITAACVSCLPRELALAPLR